MAVIAKKDSDKVRVIHNLSAPKGSSVNDMITPEFAKTTYDRFDAAVAMVWKVGPGARMANVDLKAAFKNIVV